MPSRVDGYLLTRYVPVSSLGARFGAVFFSRMLKGMSTTTTEWSTLCTAWPFVEALPFPLMWASAGSLKVASLSLLRFLLRRLSDSIRGLRRGLRKELRALAMDASGENMMREFGDGG